MKRVLLFGSRAKGTARERSDIDIAVEGAEDFEAFCEKIDDIDTLFTIDIVNLNTCKNGLLMEDIETYFSITFELAWKVMKDILTGYYEITDFVSGSPKEVLKKAFSAELISDDRWLMMLRVRNELAHDYDSEIIKERCRDITECYVDLLYKFSDTAAKLYQK